MSIIAAATWRFKQAACLLCKKENHKCFSLCLFSERKAAVLCFERAELKKGVILSPKLLHFWSTVFESICFINTHGTFVQHKLLRWKNGKYIRESTSDIILTGNRWPRPLPDKAGLRREGLRLGGRPTEIEAGIMFEAVPDTQEVPLANQISR